MKEALIFVKSLSNHWGPLLKSGCVTLKKVVGDYQNKDSAGSTAPARYQLTASTREKPTS